MVNIEMAQTLLNRPNASSAIPFPLSKQGGELRVMSYNIRIDHVDDRSNHHAWEHRLGLVAGLIQAYESDIVAVQEADSNQIADLHRLLPQYSLESFAAGQGRIGEESLLFLYNKNILELNESAVFSLSPTPNRPGRGWDARYERSLVFGKFRDRRSKKTLAVINTHFDHIGRMARQEGAQVLLAIQEKMSLGIPCVVLGDFNCNPQAGGDDLYELLINPKSGLYDVRDRAQDAVYGPDGTWIGWEYEPTKSPPNEAGWRLDLILTNAQVKVIRTGVIAATVDDTGKIIPDFLKIAGADRKFPSDHLPVVADIVL